MIIKFEIIFWYFFFHRLRIENREAHANFSPFLFSSSYLFFIMFFFLFTHVYVHKVEKNENSQAIVDTKKTIKNRNFQPKTNVFKESLHPPQTTSVVDINIYLETFNKWWKLKVKVIII